MPVETQPGSQEAMFFQAIHTDKLLGTNLLSELIRSGIFTPNELPPLSAEQIEYLASSQIREEDGWSSIFPF